MGAVARLVDLPARTLAQPRDRSLLHCLVVAAMKGNHSALAQLISRTGTREAGEEDTVDGEEGGLRDIAVPPPPPPLPPPEQQQGNACFLDRLVTLPGVTPKEYQVPGRALVTPLVAAAAAGHVRCVDLLLAAGSSANQPLPRTGLTAPSLAVKRRAPRSLTSRRTMGWLSASRGG